MKAAARELAAPALLTLCVFSLAGLYPIDNTDTFGHLAAGRQIAALGQVPQYDTFSYFRSTPARYVNYEWLSDWLLFALYDRGGSALLHTLKVLVFAVLSCLLVGLAQLRAASTGAWLVPVFVLAGMPAIRLRLSVRPHLFGYVFSALCLLGITRLLTSQSARERRALIAVLGIAHVLWVNMHGSHLLGLLFVGMAMLSALAFDRSRLRPLAAVFGCMLLASCVSPYGPRIVWGAIAHALDPAYRAVIDEWQAWRPSQSLWYPAMLLWQTLWLAASFALCRPRPDARRTFEALYCSLLIVMAVRSTRFSADAVALTIPPLVAGLAPALTRWPDRVRRASFLAGAVCALALAIQGCLALPPQASFGFGESTRGRPAASGQWLAAHLPRARIFATMSDGWDLMFTVPEAKVLLDGRTPLYGPEHIQRVQRAWSSPAALRALIDSTGTDVVVAQPAIAEQQPALRALSAFSDFRLVAIEAEHCAFARTLPDRAGLLRQRALTTLQPGYDPAWLFSDGLDRRAVERELSLLPEHPNVVPYRDWVRALVKLRPLVRDAGRSGIAAPRNAAEHTALTEALPLLRATARDLDWVPSVNVFHALVAAATCHFDEAESALERARSLGATREVAFGAQELALRRGERERVQTFLTRVLELPEAQGDPWVARLQRELYAGPRCPAPAR